MTNIIGLGQLRSHTCGYMDLVAAGETIGVVRRGKLAGWIRSTGDGRLAQPNTGVNGNGRTNLLPVDLGEFRCRAGRYFDQVAAGRTVEVVHRGKRVARITATQR
jgi:antitoxin (DNA-binding transcriptional repressor) of toxin-antitoxin stability system